MAVEATGIGVWNYDPCRRTTMWNAQLYRLLGLDPRQGPEDAERFFGFIHPEDREGIVANLDALLKSSDDNIDEEFRIIRADGKTRWLASRGRIYRDKDGRPVRISGINYDITERKKAEETVHLAQLQLAAQLAETERVNSELSQFAYAVSHDLKAPLRAIRNYADFLYEDLSGTLTDEHMKYLEGMKKAVDEGNALISDLLNLSRIDGIDLETEIANVPEILNEIIYRLRPPPETSITIQPEWPQVRIDCTLLRQIFQNLISNSLKFNESATKRIEIGWQSSDDSNVDFYVRDNGIGIEPQYFKQIFRIFQRLHTDRLYEGTGIGLAIVQKAAAKLGGAVWVESEPGKGSTFYVQLPRDINDHQPATEDP